MKALALIALASGCGTVWLGTQLTGTQGVWDEHEREVRVPRPELSEELTVSLPLVIEYEPRVEGRPLELAPFALRCDGEQQGGADVYRAAFRYGSRWKKETAVMFLLEGALASVLLLAADDSAQPAGWFFAADAALAGALFLVPRKELYAHDVTRPKTRVRYDCPDGVELAIGGAVFPVDAAGRIGDAGVAAVDAWMAQPTGSLEVRYGGFVHALDIGPDDRCRWVSEHHGPCSTTHYKPSVATTFPLPAGALTKLAAR